MKNKQITFTINRRVLIIGIILALSLAIGLTYYIHKVLQGPKFANTTASEYANQLPYLKKNAEKNPTSIKDVRDYANALYTMNQNTEAQEQYEKVVALNQNDYVSFNRLGTVYRNNGEYQKAAEAYIKAIQLNSTSINPHVNLANLYIYNLNQKEKGYETLENVISLNPENISLLLLLAKSYHQQGDLQLAKVTYQRILAIDSSNQDAQDALSSLN